MKKHYFIYDIARNGDERMIVNNLSEQQANDEFDFYDRVSTDRVVVLGDTVNDLHTYNRIANN